MGVHKSTTPPKDYTHLDALPIHIGAKGAIIERINMIYLCFTLEQIYLLFAYIGFFPSNNGPY